MPTVLRAGGFSFRFYSDEHEPPHIHCKNSDGVAIVEISTCRVMRTEGEIRDRDIRKALALVREHRDLLEAEWRDFAARRVK